MGKKSNKYAKLLKNPKAENDSKQQTKISGDGMKDSRIFIDGTLGGGGHSLYLLQNLQAGDVVIGCDIDPSALTTASARLSEYLLPGVGILNCNENNEKHSIKINQYKIAGYNRNKPIFLPIRSNFRDLVESLSSVNNPLTDAPFLSESMHGFADGILLDLGVSSHQIDNAERGFAFMKDGPLDMRMGAGEYQNHVNVDEFSSQEQHPAINVTDNINFGGLTAADICNEFSCQEIERILKLYGDEPRAKRIALSIVDHRPLCTTQDLVKAVSAVTPQYARKGRRMGLTATLARVFQSLRIVVNEEDVALEEALLQMAPSLVKKGGRLVVLSYHSMEDRAAKRAIRDGIINVLKKNVVHSSISPSRDLYGNIIDTGNRPWKPIWKKSKASDEEIEYNSRARSATLRVAERQ
eukprot:CAMPEP_0184858752 /NCGR_PEP_ID=MMETSP0580-20130426/3818_1 /TAXON_ID=1118495 /ORGANISM="Dactyliosolen fragilissimus" /LENGTH=409 /DNA_ID=CAMNT_0027355055 /DNA_START=472 /DNA_END=1701 /DNA_ORIENTATION=-